MKEIKDTTKEPHPEWLSGLNPGAIERQEKEGQMELVQSCQLPAKVNHPRGAYAYKEYEKMGIEMIGPCDDQLFWKVKLPEGWRVRATDHPMWSELIDGSGKVMASIFYKAAFYDRDAFINIEERKPEVMWWWTTREKLDSETCGKCGSYAVEVPEENHELSGYWKLKLKEEDVLVYCSGGCTE